MKTLKFALIDISIMVLAPGGLVTLWQNMMDGRVQAILFMILAPLICLIGGYWIVAATKNSPVTFCALCFSYIIIGAMWTVSTNPPLMQALIVALLIHVMTIGYKFETKIQLEQLKNNFEQSKEKNN